MDDESSSPKYNDTMSPAFLNPQNVVLGFIVMIIFSVFFACGIFFSLPDNILSAPKSNKSRQLFNAIMPQSWVFTAASPEATDMTPYRVTGNTIFRASAFPNGKAENFLGASRRQRSQIPEIQRLRSLAKEWADCSGLETEEACLVKASQEISPSVAKNDSPSPSLCADILLSESKPVPWPEREEHQEVRLPLRATYMKIECP